MTPRANLIVGALLGISAVVGTVGLLLQTSAKVKRLSGNAYPVVAGHTYVATIHSTLPVGTFAPALQAFFPAGDLAETDVADTYQLTATASAGGTLTDNPPNWTIESWVDYAQPPTT
jgi:hypothetical protein